MSSTEPSPGRLRLAVEATSDLYDSNDQRWMDQVATLHEALRQSAGDVSLEMTPTEGHKGGAEAIILALGSAGAIKAAFELFKAFINRDRGRKIKVTVGDGKKSRVLEIGGLSDAGMEKLASKLIREHGEF